MAEEEKKAEGKAKKAEDKGKAKKAEDKGKAKKAESKAEGKSKAKKAEGKAEPKAKTAEPKAKTAEPKAKTAEPKTKPATKAKPAAKPPPARRAPADGGAPPLVRASARYVRSSARKGRMVADHIRGKDVVEAKALLRFSPRGIARDLEKLLDSALANAEHNNDLVGDELRIKEIYVDEGPTIKRFRPRARGRAARINKRTSHLSIVLTPKE